MLLLDLSDSMVVNPANGCWDWFAVKKEREASKNIVNMLIGNNRCGIVGFTHISWLQQGLTTNKNLLKYSLDSMYQYGGTRIGLGISTAIAHVEQMSGSDRDKIFILLSDGYTEEIEEAKEMAQEAKKKGIKINTIAIGSDVDKALMLEIADLTANL